MNTYALVDQNGDVTNLVTWDGESEINWGEGVTAVQAVGFVNIGFKYENGAFIDPNAMAEETLESAQTAQIEANNDACQSAITDGFQSSALGAWCTYPSDLRNQQNLTASMVASLAPGIPDTWVTPFWCEDANGVWAFVYHTAAQIQKVHADSKAAIVQLVSKNAQLKAQVAAAKTVADVQAVKW